MVEVCTEAKNYLEVSKEVWGGRLEMPLIDFFGAES